MVYQDEDQYVRPFKYDFHHTGEGDVLITYNKS